MPHEQMIDAFSAIIQNSLSLYEEQTPLYYYLTICGSWVLTALGILSLASVFFTVKQKKPYRFIRMRRKTSPFTAEISGEDCEAVLKTFNFSQAYFAAQYIAE